MSGAAAEWDHDSAVRKPRWIEELRALTRSGPLVRELVSRDLKVRYKRSVLGVFWSMLVPLSMLMVLTLVFKNVFSTRGSYPIYLFPGLVLWNFFSQTSAAIASSTVANADLFRRIRVAKTAPAVATIGGGIIHLAVGTLACVVLLLIVTRGAPLVLLVSVPAAIAIAAVFTFGWSLLLAAMSVDFYDLPNAYQGLLPVLMFLSPVLYPPHVLPAGVAKALAWNPLSVLVTLFRTPFTEGHAADARTFAIGAAMALLFAVAGWIAFTRKADELSYRG